jgi:hypothetical protein
MEDRPEAPEDRRFKRRSEIADLVVKSASALVLVLGGVVGYFSFSHRLESDLEQRQRDFRVKFYDAQLALYRDATQYAAEIADARTFAEAAEPRRKLLDLYWGPLGLVEALDVEAAMVAFERVLDRWTSDAQPPPPELRARAFDLAQACRRSLGVAFGVSLLDVPARK